MLLVLLGALKNHPLKYFILKHDGILYYMDRFLSYLVREAYVVF